MGLGSFFTGLGNSVTDFAASFGGAVLDTFSGVSQGNIQRLADTGLISSSAAFGAKLGGGLGSLASRAVPIIAARVLPPVPVFRPTGIAGGDPLGGLLGSDPGAIAREITGLSRTTSAGERDRGQRVSTATFFPDVRPRIPTEVEVQETARDFGGTALGGVLQEVGRFGLETLEDVLRADTGLIPRAGPGVADLFFGPEGEQAMAEATTSGGRSLVSQSGRGQLTLAPPSMRARAPRTLIFPVPTASGGSRLVQYRNMGSPILWSGDRAAVKRVKRARSRIGKGVGRSRR